MEIGSYREPKSTLAWLDVAGVPAHVSQSRLLSRRPAQAAPAPARSRPGAAHQPDRRRSAGQPSAALAGARRGSLWHPLRPPGAQQSPGPGAGRGRPGTGGVSGSPGLCQPGLLSRQGRTWPGGADLELPGRARPRHVEVFDDPERLLQLLERLTDQHEAGRVRTWQVADAPADYVQGMLRAIRGLRLPLDSLQGTPSSARIATPPIAKASARDWPPAQYPATRRWPS